MTEISETEKELLEVSGFKGKYADRQDYLAALTQAIEARVTDDEFDSLTDEAVEWYQEAVNAINSNLEIPDFADEGDEETETDSEEEGEADDEAGSGGATTAPEGADETGDSEGNDNDDGNAEPKRRSNNSNARKTKKAAQKTSGSNSKPSPKPRDYTALTGEKDRYGIIIGTKTADAVAMYERGCTSREIRETLGGSHYNILKKLVKDGHKVLKEDGGIWRVVHKDDYGKRARGKV